MELRTSVTEGEVGGLNEQQIAIPEAREDVEARKMRIVQRQRG